MEIRTGAVVGFEALARWPDTPGATPDLMFATARQRGHLTELDWDCRLAAVEGAIDFGLGRELTLFVNVEPSTIGRAAPSENFDALGAAQAKLHVILELTERALAQRPAELLRKVGWARERHLGIALDDVGAEPESLALLPFLSPDVIKLDMTLVTNRPNHEQAAIMTAVMAHAERTGTIVLAEGVETQRHVDQALALGATLGQGWLFGRPGPLVDTPPPSTPIPFAPPDAPIAPTPFSLVAGGPQLVVGRKGLLLDLARHIERQGLDIRPAPVVLSSFQTAHNFTSATKRRYVELAARCPLVCALGVGLAVDAAPGVHGRALLPSDPLVGEWTVTVVGSHYAAALISRDLGDDGPDHDRRFEFIVTHDRELVIAAARSLMARITIH